jgi:hypothetical protein
MSTGRGRPVLIIPYRIGEGLYEPEFAPEDESYEGSPASNPAMPPISPPAPDGQTPSAGDRAPE